MINGMVFVNLLLIVNVIVMGMVNWFVLNFFGIGNELG